MRRDLQERAMPLVTAARNKFYVDRMYGAIFVVPGRRLAAFFADFFDRRIVDGVVNGAAWLVARVAESLRRVQTGYVRSYAAVFLLGVVVLFSVLIVRVGPG